MFAPYRGRSQTIKQKRLKAKISYEERSKRLARKKLLQMFPNAYVYWLQFLPSQKTGACVMLCRRTSHRNREGEAPLS